MKPVVRVLLLTIFVFQAGPGLAQISIGLIGGFGSMQETKDTYGLNSQWPAASNNQSGNAITFFAAGSGPVFGGFLAWEASPIVSVAALYRTNTFTMSTNKRTGGSSSMGVQFKVNFVKNTKPVVPFIQVEYMFLNTTHLVQNQATSTIYANQTQPAFDHSFSTNLGIGGDLGAEFRLQGPFSLMVTAGVHGVQMTSNDEDIAFLKTVPYSTSFAVPQYFDGYAYLQFGAGIKYYTGRNKKKRDF